MGLIPNGKCVINWKIWKIINFDKGRNLLVLHKLFQHFNFVSTVDEVLNETYHANGVTNNFPQERQRFSENVKIQHV